MLFFKNLFSPSQTNFWLPRNLVYIRSAGIPDIAVIIADAIVVFSTAARAIAA